MDYQEFKRIANQWMEEEGITAQWYVKFDRETISAYLDGKSLAHDLIMFDFVEGYDENEPPAELVEHAQRYLDDTYDGGEP